MLVVGTFYNPNNDLDSIESEKGAFQDHVRPLDSLENFDYEIFDDKEMKTLMKNINVSKDRLVWFHFSGHHDEKGVRLNEGTAFTSLVDQLLSCKKLKGVFINGCASKSTLDKLAEKVPICIGTYEPIYDSIATEFSDLFYEKMNSIEKWEDYDKIHEEFHEALKNLYDLEKAEKHKSSLIARGGGSLDDAEKPMDYYFISPKNELSRKKFDSIDDDKVISENPNQKLVEILDELDHDIDFPGLSNRPYAIRLKAAKKYINKPPLIFKEILKAFGLLVGDTSFGFEKLGSERYILIKNYFYAYLDLYRYSVLSLSWDFSKNGFNVDDFITEVGLFGSDNIEMLNNHLKMLASKLQGPRLKYIEDLLASETLLKEGAEFFINDSKDFLNVERYFYKLLAATKFLNDYQFRSIYSRNYMKNRIDEEKYMVKFVHGITKKAVPYSKNDEVSYDCIYSIYICDKNIESTIVNLSPFYFDKNFIESEKKLGSASGKIDLYVLKEKDEEFNEGVKFDYLSIYKPYKRINVENLYLIKSSEDENISIIEEDEEDDKINSEYSVDKSYIVKSLFKELTSIIT